MKTVRYNFKKPVYGEDLNNGGKYLIGDLDIDAIVTVFNDGYVKCVDIDSVHFQGSDITKYLINITPSHFEQLRSESESHYKSTLSHEPRKKSPDNS